MITSCAVYGCSSKSSDVQKKSFFTFPHISKITKEWEKDLIQERLLKWVNVINRKYVTSENCVNLRVCSLHFLTGNPSSLSDKNHPDWAPSQNLGYSFSTVRQDVHDLQRFQRACNRARVHDENRVQDMSDPAGSSSNDLENEIQNVEKAELPENVDNAGLPEKDTNSREVDTQISVKVNDLVQLFESLIKLQKGNERLQKRLNILTLSQDTFLNNNSRTLYYTGLNSYKTLFLIFKYVSPYLYTNNPAVSPFTQLIITFLKLRLNLPFKYLADRFEVSMSTVSKYFRRCVHALYSLFKNLVRWPERGELYSTMPQCFLEAFGRKVTVIIDCFEVFLERPSNKLSASECWSSYKHHTTAKNLIGIAPQGSVTYISEGWGGRTSDKYLTENCDLTKNLEIGDLVLADRGFTVNQVVNEAGALLNIPAFTKGVSQLHPRDIEETRKIANVRIHVERVIGSIRQKYTILSRESLPNDILKTDEITGTSTYDEIVFVCCAFVNLCPGIVN